ncbi:MAG: hypothetical protein OHK0013_42650 [Sandaracinaceae bacterium]
MEEVSVQAVALVAESLAQRGVDPCTLWLGLPVDRRLLADRSARIDWETWVVLLERAELACGGPEAMMRLFVPGTGVRTKHGFTALARAFASSADLYKLLARWGFPRTTHVLSGDFEPLGEVNARFRVSIDPSRAGSLPTLRFMVGLLAAIPTLRGLAPALVTLRPGATPHHAEYHLVLPRDARWLTRTRRLLALARGSDAALDALEELSAEIGRQNAELDRQIAELAAARAKLEERDAWLELALDAGRVAIWQLDLASGEMHASAGLAEMLGLPPGARPTAEIWLAAVHPDDRQAVTDAAVRAIERRDGYEIDYRVQRPDGVAWLRAKARVLRAPSGGGGLVAIGTVADVTAQKSLEARLRFADRFIAAGTLAAGVAHEINNPLAYLLGNVELMRRRLATDHDRERFAEALDDMADGLHRIRDVVRDLSTLSRPEEEVVTPVDVRRVIDAAIRIVTPSVKHRTRVETRYADAPLPVLANESRLGQVFMNLLLNASQAMPERPRSESLVQVSARREGERVVVEVVDNGSGIAPEHLPRLFDPFVTTKDVGLGTGLGLSVCQGIVHALGGAIEVESSLGVGSTFRVLLPAARALSAAEATPSVEAPVRGTVLVVDDERLVRRAIVRLLEERGYTVLEAESAAEARTLAETHPDLDVIVCDVVMPEQSGAELRAHLERTRPELARRMVFVTGGAATEAARAFLDGLGGEILRKPFDVRALVASIEQARRR